MLTATVDTRGLQFLINGLNYALIGTGGDASTIVKDESRLLAVQVSKLAQPKDRKKTGQRIERSVRGRFQELNNAANSMFEDKPDKEGHAGIKWYRSDSRFLWGVARDSDMRKADPQTVANIYYHAKTLRGKTRIVLPFKHPRTEQQVVITTRVLTSKSVLRKAIEIVKKGIGRLPASWLASAKQIDSGVTGPQWIERHIHNGTTRRAITDLSQMNMPEKPMVTFGSKAVGVEKFNRQIQFAVKLREKKVAARLNLVLSGYSKDVAQGIKIKRHAHRQNE